MRSRSARHHLAQRSAAALALRWHAGTGTLVALTAALTLAGAVPALLLLGGSAAAPALTLGLSSTPDLLRDWSGRGSVWPQLQQLALLRLTGILQGAVILTLAVGAATLIALHLARTAARSGEVIVARSVGASRRDILGAMMLEAGALAGVALFVGMLLALAASAVMRSAWPGPVGAADLALGAAATLGVTALVIVAPLLLVRALSTTRLVDDDRRPLTLIIPALQLGAAVVVLAGGVTLRGVTATQVRNTAGGRTTTTLVQDVRADEPNRLVRAQRFAAFLAEQHRLYPAALVSLGSSGVHRGFGTSASATSDCGRLCGEYVALRGTTETVVHHAVSSDTFTLAGMQVQSGRALTDRDRWDAPLVVVVNTSFANAMFPGGDAVGRRVQLPLLDSRWFEVVGVVSDATVRGLGSSVQSPLAVYVSVLQHPVAQLEVATLQRHIAPDALRRAGIPTGVTSSVAERLAPETRALRWFTNVLLAMGGVTALIAIGGLIAMLRLWLDSQQRELGIRRAVGARRRQIHALLLGRAALVAAGGSMFGAWMGQIGWDVLPRIVPGAPTFNGAVVLQTCMLLSAFTLAVAAVMAARFTRTPVGTLLIDEG